MSKVVRICPSILNADHAHLNSEIDRVSSADLLHLDIMDNIFVPNQTFSFHQTKEIISYSQIPVDTHLMIHNPDELAVDYAAAWRSVHFKEIGLTCFLIQHHISATPRTATQCTISC